MVQNDGYNPTASAAHGTVVRMRRHDNDEHNYTVQCIKMSVINDKVYTVV